jgi:hypothetical protein
MRSERSQYDRYIEFYAPTYVNTEGSVSTTNTLVFTGYAGKIKNSSSRIDDTDIRDGKRTTEEINNWAFPYNEGIVVDGFFYENGNTAVKYVVTGITDPQRESEMIVQTLAKR